MLLQPRCCWPITQAALFTQGFREIPEQIVLCCFPARINCWRFPAPADDSGNAGIPWSKEHIHSVRVCVCVCGGGGVRANQMPPFRLVCIVQWIRSVRHWWRPRGDLGRTSPDTADAGAEKLESLELINTIRVTNRKFKRLGTSRLHELRESKFPFVSRIKIIRPKLSNFPAHVSGARVSPRCPTGCLSCLVRFFIPVSTRRSLPRHACGESTA